VGRVARGVGWREQRKQAHKNDVPTAKKERRESHGGRESAQRKPSSEVIRGTSEVSTQLPGVPFLPGRIAAGAPTTWTQKRARRVRRPQPARDKTSGLDLYIYIYIYIHIHIYTCIHNTHMHAGVYVDTCTYV
jgi:hypothetical protein